MSISTLSWLIGTASCPSLSGRGPLAGEQAVDGFQVGAQFRRGEPGSPGRARKKVQAAVTGAARRGRVSHREELDRVDPQRDQVIEAAQHVEEAPRSGSAVGAV